MTPARAAYTAFVIVALPFAALYLLWRSRRQPAYRSHWAERFGFARYPPHVRLPVIWIHAVSLGETRAAEPLIAGLAQRFPSATILLTHMTPTGRAAGADVVARWPGRVLQAYLPYDLPFAVRRFMRAFRPVLGVCMETETWPNLLAVASEQRVPVVLVNARLSDRSYQLSRRYATLMRETAARFALVLAQSEADAARMRAAGAAQVEVLGNLKFDFTPDEALVAQGQRWRLALGERPVWLWASTREGEEALLLAALSSPASATLIIVPRHPQRFDDVARLIRAQGVRWSRRSEQPFAAADVILGDSIGEMALYYAACDVAFIGGSLARLGGQNLIEACAVGTPVVVGPHTFNFEQATSDAIDAGAAVRAGDAAEAVATMAAISGQAERRQRMSEAAVHFAAAHRGATARTVERLAPFIVAAAAAPAAPVPAAERQGS